MKTKSVLLALVLFLVSIGAVAGNPVTLENVVENADGKLVEQTVMKEGTNEMDRKVVTQYNTQNVAMERVTYKWNIFGGWEPQTKMKYSYTENKRLSEIEDIAWNKKAKDWDKNSKITRYDEFGIESKS